MFLNKFFFFDEVSPVLIFTRILIYKYVKFESLLNFDFSFNARWENRIYILEKSCKLNPILERIFL